VGETVLTSNNSARGRCADGDGGDQRQCGAQGPEYGCGVAAGHRYWQVLGTVPLLVPLHSTQVTICQAAAMGLRKNGGDWYFSRGS
jgi:hypothetical protein